MGTLSGAMSEFFGRPVTEAVARFSWLGIGITAGSVCSLFVYEWLSLKKVFVLCYLGLIAALVSMCVIEAWAWLPMGLLLAGTTASLGLNTAAVTLSLKYTARRRAAVLLCTDVCFAGAGIVAAPGAAALLHAGFSWNSSYLVIALVALVVLVLVSISRYPPTASESASERSPERWPASLYFCGVGLALYLLGQVSMLLWLPNYLESSLLGTREQGAAAISAYWSGMALGQISLMIALIRMSTQHLLTLICGASVLLSFLLWTVGSPSNLITSALLLGFCNAGILKLTLAFAASLVGHPQRVITTILFCASLGQLVSPLISSTLVAATTMQSGLQLVTGCYLLAAGCILFALYRSWHTVAKEDSPDVA